MFFLPTRDAHTHPPEMLKRKASSVGVGFTVVNAGHGNQWLVSLNSSKSLGPVFVDGKIIDGNVAESSYQSTLDFHFWP